MPFKDLEIGQTHSFHLAFCGMCKQMTNHYDDGRCAKCGLKAKLSIG